MRSQQRIGPPGQKFWAEGPKEIFLRFKHLLEAQGIIAPIKVDGKTVTVVPFNPAVQSQEAQEVQQSTRFLEIVKGFFPAESQVAIDGFSTIEKLKEKMSEELVELRPQEEAAQLLPGLLGAATGGREGTPQ